MQPLDLNLASRPFRNNLPLWAGYATATLVVVAFTVWNVVAYRSHARQLDELRNTVTSMESQSRDLEQRDAKAHRDIAAFDREALAAQAVKANEIIDWKAFSWTRLFNLLEKIQPNDVRMTSVRPVFRTEGGREGAPGQSAAAETAASAVSMPVTVEGTARAFEALWDFQNVLYADPHFGRVDPERLSTNAQGEIEFELSFLYYPQSEPATADTPEADAAEPPVEGPVGAAGPDGAQADGADPVEGNARAPAEWAEALPATAERGAGREAGGRRRGAPGSRR